MAINSFMIPASAMPQSSSYSGMGQGWTDFSNQTVKPIISNLVSGFGNFSKPYNEAASGMTQYVNTQLAPAMQGILNKLAGRGMINSSVASDAMSKGLTGLLNNAQGYQAQLMGNAAGNYAPFVQGVGQMGQYSSSSSKDASAPYQIMAQLLQNMM